MLKDPNLRYPLAISLGAIAGALSRYYITLWFANRFGINFPYGTFFINISGCLAMGFFTTLAVEKMAIISPEIRLMVATGFLGAYTTFSTYGLDTINLFRSRAFLLAVSYWLGSALLGIIGVQLGIVLAKMWR
ncbi:fluoride efflux transporter CrcB [Nostoc sp. FACHB-152]|uniref:fluoride efflux transporter CrcB n=1 Tax=unclassified Nostoc TaxID=2593658 RepID=UPI00168853EC|nr:MULTISPECIES: fluoride efflux transporter CrcB [unclassified Nostoc]MBD2448304.1 fluoride efflux transporter CrcB [Nostoc sp. FACHB-152]MBD2467466.1 fluoride efflux transporter CrcB [Nostoc sp. FACHB-145]